MFRPTLLLNAASKATLYRSAPAFSRFYSAGALAQSDIESRVLDILKGFDRLINPSLDTVEVVMAIEEDFSVEIPDKEADDIKTPRQAVEYISHRSDAH
ncbi:unnamed protein product [Absidia cylindrospora]